MVGMKGSEGFKRPGMTCVCCHSVWETGERGGPLTETASAESCLVPRPQPAASPHTGAYSNYMPTWSHYSPVVTDYGGGYSQHGGICQTSGIFKYSSNLLTNDIYKL